MDGFDFTKSSLNGGGGTIADGADFHQGAQQRPGAAYFT
jgi:hypothetical protein